MTISYNLDVTSSRFHNFAKLLWRWHGSIWKSVYKELAAWMIVYAFLSMIYRVILNHDQKKRFEEIVEFCYRHSGLFPLTFMLGFFVTVVVQRWWEMFGYFGWIENIALYVATYINGEDERTRMIRRNIIRYVVLVEAMVFRDVSPVVRRRFPDDDAFQLSGFLTEKEGAAMKSVVSNHGKYWLPIHWSFDLVKQARQSGNISHDRAAELILERIREFRTGLSKLRAFSWVPVPLAYTQLVFLAVRSYLALSVMGRQYVENSNSHKEINTPVDLYIPFLTIIQFIFNLGWMKVAEALLNPYGNDDDDFECNWFIDRNLQVGLSIVDDAIGKEPPLEKDVFWNDITPTPLYLNGAKNVPIHHINPSPAERVITWCGEKVLPRSVAGPRLVDYNANLKEEKLRGIKAAQSHAEKEPQERDITNASLVDDSVQSPVVRRSQQEKFSKMAYDQSKSGVSIVINQ